MSATGMPLYAGIMGNSPISRYNNINKITEQNYQTIPMLIFLLKHFIILRISSKILITSLF